MSPSSPVTELGAASRNPQCSSALSFEIGGRRGLHEWRTDAKSVATLVRPFHANPLVGPPAIGGCSGRTSHSISASDPGSSTSNPCDCAKSRIAWFSRST